MAFLKTIQCHFRSEVRTVPNKRTGSCPTNALPEPMPALDFLEKIYCNNLIRVLTHCLYLTLVDVVLAKPLHDELKIL